jgi:hypothetical protein
MVSGCATWAGPEPSHPYEQRAITAAKSKTRWSLPQSNSELMTEKQILSFKPGLRLDRSATNIPSACRIVNIAVGTENLSPGVTAMEPAQDRVRKDGADALNWTTERRIFVQ